MSRPYLHPQDIATALGDPAAAGSTTAPAEAEPSPSWGLIAAFFALWVATSILFLRSIN